MAAPQEDILLPMNGYVLFVKDEPETKSKAGLILTESAKTPTLTGRIVAIAKDVSDDPAFYHLKELDRVIVNYVGYVPVELTAENKRFFLPATSIVGVYKKPSYFDED